jgi:murein DD-endopeptidase MepM/ murein hydrolase activator NlpD
LLSLGFGAAAAQPPDEALVRPAAADLPRPYHATDGGGRLPASGLATFGSQHAASWSHAMSRHDVLLGDVNPDHDDGYLYRLPYGDDVTYPVIQSYGAKLSHRGAEQFTVDFGMPIGTPVHAAREGVVVLVEDSHDGGCFREECSRLANFVVVLHSDGTTGEYFHLARGSVAVRRGDIVSRGERLAASGDTGYSTAPHLHFGVYRAAADGETQSVAIRFGTRTGAIALPRTGSRYLNVQER